MATVDQEKVSNKMLISSVCTFFSAITLRFCEYKTRIVNVYCTSLLYSTLYILPCTVQYGRLNGLRVQSTGGSTRSLEF